jgi:hypothetical protein
MIAIIPLIALVLSLMFDLAAFCIPLCPWW